MTDMDNTSVTNIKDHELTCLRARVSELEAHLDDVEASLNRAYQISSARFMDIRGKVVSIRILCRTIARLRDALSYIVVQSPRPDEDYTAEQALDNAVDVAREALAETEPKPALATSTRTDSERLADAHKMIRDILATEGDKLGGIVCFQLEAIIAPDLTEKESPDA